MRQIALLMGSMLMIISCAPTHKVTRLDVSTQVDLSGRWNDTDSRLVANEMINDVLSRAWLTDFVTEHGKKPVVIVGTIRNLSTEHINVETFVTDMERELINSGEIKFVASRQQRGEVREERHEQQQYSTEETAKRLAAETGADFMLKGSIKTIEDTIDGKKVIFYQTDLELINIESNEKAWIGSKKIKKYIERSKYKW